MASCRAVLKFHSAGQGLFATGEIFEVPRSHPQVFRWVYDCGSTSGRKTVLKESIDSYVSSFPTGQDRIVDLVVISHFDRDHINGLVDLLHRARIHTLLIPLLPITTRAALLLAEKDDANSDLARFLFDPAAFVASIRQGDQGVEQIIFVPSSNGIAGDTAAGVIDDGQDDFGGLNYPRDPKSSEIIEAHGLSSDGGIKLSVVRTHGVMCVRNWWEFVPYNDAAVPALSSAVTAQVEILVRKFKTALDKKVRKVILDKLKKIYEAHFPTQELRNRISLFLFGGPMGETKSLGSEVLVEGDPYPYHLSRHFVEIEGGYGLNSVLYTGDGYLDTRESLKALRAYLGPERMERICAFQVMHHGARDNWFRGLADEISPLVSIFSSDPDHHYGHPHPEVLRDFWMHGPLQVDRCRGIEIGHSFKN